MILWNTAPQELLQIFFDALSTKATVPFLIVSWPSHVGKTTCIEQHIMKLLWLFVAQDYLPLYDCEATLWKKHTLKVDVASKDQSIELASWRVVQNLWTRNASERLSRSPAGEWKILFLENIERMTITAANALLKSLEEPLPNRLIVATTKNYKLLLDTIISRAMIIRFQPVPLWLVEEYCGEHYKDTAEPIRRFVVWYSAWCPWRALWLLDQDQWLSAMADCFNACLRFYQAWWSTVEQFQRLQKRQKEYGTVSDLIDGLLYALQNTKEPKQQQGVQQLIAWKKLLQTNVSVDTILFSLSVDASHLDATIA